MTCFFRLHHLYFNSYSFQSLSLSSTDANRSDLCICALIIASIFCCADSSTIEFFMRFFCRVNFLFIKIRWFWFGAKKKPFFKFNDHRTMYNDSFYNFTTNENTGTGIVDICVTAFFIFLFVPEKWWVFLCGRVN